MAHVYRAIWRNDDIDVLRGAIDCFEAWLRLRNTPIPIRFDGVSRNDSRTVAAARISTPSKSGVQIVLREALSDGRGHWSTSVTAMRVGDGGCLWVDVDAQVDNIWQRSIAAPRVVRELLLAGGRPYVGEDVLEVQPQEIDDRKSLDRLAESILSPRRELPLVVIGERAHQDQSRSQLMQIATRTSDMLAGVAQVSVVDGRHLSNLNALLPESLSIQPLAARVFISGVHAETESERYTTTLDLGAMTGNYTDLGALIARRIAITTSWPTIEPQFIDFRESLSARRREQGYISSSGSHDQVEVLSTPDPLEERAPRSPAPREPSGSIEVLGSSGSIAKGVQSAIRELRDQVKSLQDELIDVTEQADEWYEEAQWYKERLVRMLINEENSTEFKGPTMASVIEDVRRHAQYITIPTTAPREIEALDTNMAAVVWAKDLAQLFASMERYATARISGKFDGSYLEWCSKMADYSAAKIAMQESEPTKKNPRLRASRTFEVSRDLDPSGWKVMFAHAKIQARGGSLIPRLFFHDDVVGKTKKIHIGFIGPHHLVPTSTF